MTSQLRNNVVVIEISVICSDILTNVVSQLAFGSSVIACSPYECLAAVK